MSEAILLPGVSQYSPPVASTRMSVALPSSGPPGSQASAKVFHSYLSLTSSSSTVAVPWMETQASLLEKVRPTCGRAWMSRTWSVSRAVMNHRVADGSTSWRAIGTERRVPSSVWVVNIATCMSRMRSMSLPESSVMSTPYPRALGRKRVVQVLEVDLLGPSGRQHGRRERDETPGDQHGHAAEHRPRPAEHHGD